MHTPQQVATHIKGLTQKSQDLQAPAQSITIVNGPLIMIGQGPYPQIIAGLKDIVSAGSTALSQMQGMAEVPKGKESDAICDAFREFARVHQELLKTLTGKAGMSQQVPFIGQPVAAVLRQDESVTDSLAFSLMDNVPSRASDLQAEAKSLSETIETCIQTHQGLGSS
ncbi:hypothetical protein PG985_008141 [Apiospora marii]|uniref:Uncharacterized protein n=1 Tax=Apiospora marii TaxID=335849 RepID=A0ABR1R9V6_9PEZI